MGEASHISLPNHRRGIELDYIYSYSPIEAAARSSSNRRLQRAAEAAAMYIGGDGARRAQATLERHRTDGADKPRFHAPRRRGIEQTREAPRPPSALAGGPPDGGGPDSGPRPAVLSTPGPALPEAREDWGRCSTGGSNNLQPDPKRLQRGTLGLNEDRHPTKDMHTRIKMIITPPLEPRRCCAAAAPMVLRPAAVQQVSVHSRRTPAA